MGSESVHELIEPLHFIVNLPISAIVQIEGDEGHRILTLDIHPIEECLYNFCPLEGVGAAVFPMEAHLRHS